MKLTVEWILDVTGGRLIREGEREFSRFGIDSRTIPAGALFFALKGENTDGHLFVDSAAANGAGGAIIDQDLEVSHPSFTLIKVEDTLKALYNLASAIRARSQSVFIGLTGSSGKTSTKEFTAALLSHKFNVFKSEGNLNSVTGLPLSLLSFESMERAVFELGMSKPGEIAALARLLQPHIGMVLNVNPVHLGQFPSIDAIADEKFSLLAALPENSLAIYNADDPLLVKRAATVKRKQFSFGFSETADLRISDPVLKGVFGTAAKFNYEGQSIAFRTALCGRTNLLNIAAATSVALASGLSWHNIVDGIEQLRPYKQRGVLHFQDGFHLYDDSYNSNPRALEFALEIVSQSEGFRRKIAVLGDMLELGPDEIRFHSEAGERVGREDIDVLIAAGPLSVHMAEAAKHSGVREVYHTDSSEQAAEKAAAIIREGDLVFVKGSRGLKMEKVVERLLAATTKEA